MKTFISFFIIFFFLLTLKFNAHAVCPVCTVAVAGGLGVSRWLGIDDSIAGLWVGGLIISMSLWFADVIVKKGWKIPYPKIFSIFIFYSLVISILVLANITGTPGNQLLGVDKLIFGMVLGSAAFLICVKIDNWLRKRNNGKVYIYYQKVIIPVFTLAVLSFILYFITI